MLKVRRRALLRGRARELQFAFTELASPQGVRECFADLDRGFGKVRLVHVRQDACGETDGVRAGSGRTFRARRSARAARRWEAVA